MELLNFTGTRYLERADSRPTFGGTAASEIGKTGSIALIQFGGQNYTVQIGLDGKFSWTSPVDVPDGEYSLSIIIKDRAGNQSAPILRTAIIDTTPPEAPTLLSLYDDQGEKKAFLPGDTTDDKTPTLTGLAQKGSTVFLKNGDEIIGSVVADKVTGEWVITPAIELNDGINNLTLSTQEVFDGKTRVSAESPLIINVAPDGDNGGELPPNIVTINYAIDNQGVNTGVISSGALTDDDTPELRGAVSASSNVVVYYRLAGNDVWAGSAVATIEGQNWRWTPPSALASGSYEFQASTGDFSSAPFILQIASPQDLIAKTTVDYAIDNVGVNTGLLTDGAWTDDANPELHGRGEANSTVWLYYRNDAGAWSALASVKVGADGNWIYTTERLLRGEYEFKVLPTNDSDIETTSLHVKVIAEGNNVPEILYADDNVGGYRGPIFSGEKTDDKTPVIVGKAEAHSIIFIEYQTVGGQWQSGYSAQADSSGVWRIKDIPDLAAGHYLFRAKSSDSNGYSNDFGLEVLRNDETSTIIEDFNRFKGHNVESGTIFNIGRITSGDDSVLRVSGTNLNVDSTNTYYTIDLNYEALSVSMILYDYIGSGRNQASILVFDAKDRLLERRYIDISQNAYNDIFIQPVVPLTRIVIYSGKQAIRSIDNIKVESNGEINPNATWLNDKSNEDNSNINSTLHMIDVNDEDSSYKLTRTQSDKTADNNIITTQTDTLTLFGKDQLIDLTVDNAKFEQVKIIDLTGKGDNALKLDLNALLQHGEKDLFIEDGKTQLIVKGDAGDVVKLKDILPEGSDISEWQHQEGTVTVAGVEYQVYSHGDDAELLVQQGVKTELI